MGRGCGKLWMATTGETCWAYIGHRLLGSPLSRKHLSNSIGSGALPPSAPVNLKALRNRLEQLTLEISTPCQGFQFMLVNNSNNKQE